MLSKSLLAVKMQKHANMGITKGLQNTKSYRWPVKQNQVKFRV